MAVVWNIPIACNRSSADFMISSPLMEDAYDRIVPDYDTYRSRSVDLGDGPEVTREGRPEPPRRQFPPER
jgi:methylglyoxal synthase